MALNNREIVGRALGVVSEGLEPFVADTLAEKVPPGKDWTVILSARDAVNGHPANRTLDRHDVSIQLRAVTERLLDGWYPFRDKLSHAEQSLASELRDTRNRWAHTNTFSADDTYRALDTAERLLRAVGAPDRADTVRGMREDFQRREFAGKESRARRAHSDLKQLDYGDVVAWRNVLAPRADVAEGRYATSEFAADLGQVSRGEGDDDYRDPVEFFRRTYVTEGLHELLKRSARRLTGDTSADPVINLQTNFGGGKTHSMLAVWHLAGATPVGELPQDVQEAVSDLDDAARERLSAGVRRAAVVGNHLAQGQASIKPDGTAVHTIWGEIAWQLGGAEGYARLAESDRNATNPGDHLRLLLQEYAPCVVLIDEWVAYARGLRGDKDLAGGTFDTQFSFAQTLTEAVAATPGALLLVSIPASESGREQGSDAASELEVGGVHGREALERLQNVVSRYAYEWRPASSRESFEIVRRRLFEEPDASSAAVIAHTARAFGDMYRRHTGEFPRETTEPQYENRIRDAYPLHPELFERLYSDWSSLQRFQRTRGVLRLMSAVIQSLHSSDDNAPLIMPGSIPLDAIGVRDELAKYLDDNWKPIVDTDIDGPDSTPVRIDTQRELFGKRALTRRIARAVFMGSAATLRTSHKGIERQRLFLGVAQPGDTVGNFGSALQILGDRAAYLYSDGDRYWFDTQPSLNRQVAERAEALDVEDVAAETVRRLEQTLLARHAFDSVVVAPTETGEVPEATGVTLVLLHPSTTHKKGKDSPALAFAHELFTQRGRAPRTNRNLLVALAADSDRVKELDSAVRQYLAWADIAARSEELDLTASNKAMAERRRDESNRAVKARLATTYIHLMHPVQPDGNAPMQVAVTKADGTDSDLPARVAARLTKDQQLVDDLGARNVRLALDSKLHKVWNRGRVSVGELWSYYAQYPYLDRLTGEKVLHAAVRNALSSFAWEAEAFALAEGYDEDSGDFKGLVLPGGDATFGVVRADTLLVAPGVAQAQKLREVPQDPEPGPNPSPVVPIPSPQPAPGPVPDEPVIRDASFEGRFELDADDDVEARLRAVAAEILVHLQKAGPENFEVSLKVRAEKLDGFDDWTVRTVRENASNLGVDGRFEDA